MTENKEISGVHNGGAVSVEYVFSLDGEAAVGHTVIPYEGMYPSKEYIQERILAETGGCGKVISAVNVDQAYRETNFSCPNAKFIGGKAPTNQAKNTQNHYDNARSTVLGASIPIKVKILGMRQFELNAGAVKN